jgi:hypothetical protein
MIKQIILEMNARTNQNSKETTKSVGTAIQFT